MMDDYMSGLNTIRFSRPDDVSVEVIVRNQADLDWVVERLTLPGLLAPEARFDVELLAAGERIINVIREIRDFTGMPLQQAKRLVDTVPSTVGFGLNKNLALRFQAILEGNGAEVSVHPGYTPTRKITEP